MVLLLVSPNNLMATEILSLTYMPMIFLLISQCETPTILKDPLFKQNIALNLP